MINVYYSPEVKQIIIQLNYSDLMKFVYLSGCFYYNCDSQFLKIIQDLGIPTSQIDLCMCTAGLL